jgi:hypothetical protein
MQRLLRGAAAAVSLLLATAVCGQAPPANSGDYEQLPTAWDQGPLPEPAVLPETALTSPWPSPTEATPAVAPSAYGPTTMVTPASACVDCGSGCSGTCGRFGAYPPHSFWFADVELTIVDPSYENGLFALDGDDDVVGPRLYFGWESPRGLGLRSRFWWLNDKLDYVTGFPLPTDEEQVKLQSNRFDFDAYRRFVFDASSIAVGAGISTARMRWNLDPLWMVDTGAGVSFFVEGRHEIWRREVSSFGLLARGRWASLIGDWEGELFDRERGDLTMEILEVAFGWDWIREFRRFDFIFRTLVEAQTWQSTLTEDVGFFGQTVSVGCRW